MVTKEIAVWEHVVLDHFNIPPRRVRLFIVVKSLLVRILQPDREPHRYEQSVLSPFW